MAYFLGVLLSLRFYFSCFPVCVYDHLSSPCLRGSFSVCPADAAAAAGNSGSVVCPVVSVCSPA